VRVHPEVGEPQGALGDVGVVASTTSDRDVRTAGEAIWLESPSVAVLPRRD
jgi:hypothetical protein